LLERRRIVHPLGRSANAQNGFDDHAAVGEVVVVLAFKVMVARCRELQRPAAVGAMGTTTTLTPES